MAMIKYLETENEVNIGRTVRIYITKNGSRAYELTDAVKEVEYDNSGNVISFTTANGDFYVRKERIKAAFIDVSSAKVGERAFVIADGKQILTSTVQWAFVSSYHSEVETSNTVYYQ